MGALDGKVVAITGASSGIGAATAEALAGAGAAVALGARRKDRLDELVERIGAAGGKALAIEADVAEESAAHSFVTAAHSELGGLHGLVNNAGVMLLGPFEGQPSSEWRTMVEVNLLGVLYCAAAALPLIRDSGGGDIVNVSSVAGRHANAGSSVYNLTKFGVTAFSEALRQEALHSNVRVSCVEPGYVETELQGHNTNPVVRQGLEKIREQTGQPLQAEDIANAILYALSQPAHVSINEVLVRPTGQRR
jgi:NADP-dependent 3-hydroxy acid dehydrogenase YdfG